MPFLTIDRRRKFAAIVQLRAKQSRRHVTSDRRQGVLARQRRAGAPAMTIDVTIDVSTERAECTVAAAVVGMLEAKTRPVLSRPKG